MSKVWRVGLLGAGYILDSHAKALKVLPTARVVAVCDRSIDRARAAAQAYDIPQVFSSLDDLLRADVDAIHILLPPDSHVDAARLCIEAGKHVFLEKPMGLAAAACQSLVDLAAARGVKLAVNHNFLFMPAYELLRQQAADGTLGRLDQVTINWLYPLGLIQSGPFNNWMLQEPKNLLFELGPHLLAFMVDLVGPLEQMQVDAFKPIDLPGGGRVYRRWHIHGRRDDTAVDLNLSVLPGFTDRSIFVRGHAATATCHYDRNIYFRDEPSGYGLLFDNFAAVIKIARQMAANAWSNLVKAVIATSRKQPAANPFGESIARSIGAFYQGIDGEMDSRLDGRFGVQVISACERIIAQAGFPQGERSAQSWTTQPPLRQPTVLVLGGTGFIGQYLVKALVRRGLGVRVVSRGMAAGQIALAGLPVELVQGDLADAAFLDTAMQGIEVVYDLAKAVGKKWDDYYTQDVLVTKNIAERALANGVKRFIYTGTIDSYYSADANVVITSDTPLDSRIETRNHYARSKAVCESLLIDLHRQKNLPVVIFRPGIVIGKGCPPAHWGVGMFQSETRMQFWGDGNHKLPLVLVEDVAEALALALDKPDIEGQTFLLTDEPLLSGRDYVDAVSKASGTRLRAEPTPIWKFFIVDAMKEAAKHLIKHPNRKVPSYRDWASRSHRSRYDSTKTRELLGWRPAGSREALIERGIVASVSESMK
jgi:predicted dehydrogenase/nucleoside-diphosphate-sugar epimerase